VVGRGGIPTEKMLRGKFANFYKNVRISTNIMTYLKQQMIRAVIRKTRGCLQRWSQMF